MKSISKIFLLFIIFYFCYVGSLSATTYYSFFWLGGVGVASYLLIGFYFKKPTANNAAMKAFIVNRVRFWFFNRYIHIFYYSGSINF